MLVKTAALVMLSILCRYQLPPLRI